MSVTLRPAIPDDLPRIIEISAQIWDGDDYVGAVAEDWIATPDSELVVALVDGRLMAFARLSWLLPGYAWLEGIRTDPTYQGRGLGRELTAYLLNAARSRGAQRIGLSTHTTAQASLHIIETSGFCRTAAYVLLDASPGSAARQRGLASQSVVSVSPEEAQRYIADSNFLQAARGYLAHGWKFYPFHLAPDRYVAQMAHLWGIRRGEELAGLLCSGRPVRGQGEFTIDFLDGEPEAMLVLLRHALDAARERQIIEGAVPKWNADTAPALEVYRRLGFSSWNGYEEDMFVFERAA